MLHNEEGKRHEECAATGTFRRHLAIDAPLGGVHTPCNEKDATGNISFRRDFFFPYTHRWAFALSAEGVWYVV